MAAKDIQHYKETKAKLQKAERQSYWKYLDNLIEVGDPGQEHQPKQKRLLSFVKSLRRDNSRIAPLKEDRCLHDDPKDKADIINRQYESTWTKEDKDDIPNPDGKSFQPMKYIRVTEEGILKLLMKLNPAKACGPDSIPARMLKELTHEIAPCLVSIFQRSLDTGKVPEGLENGQRNCHNQERREVQTKQLSACLPDLYMLQVSRAHHHQ